MVRGGDKSLDLHIWGTNKKRQAAIMFLYSIQRENSPILRIAPHLSAIENGSSMTMCHVRMRWKPEFSRHAAHSFARQSTSYTFLNFMQHTHKYQISRKSTYESKYKYITNYYLVINNLSLWRKFLKELKLSIDPWKTPSPSSRHEEVVITRSRIGHSRLIHLHLMTKDDRPMITILQKNRLQMFSEKYFVIIVNERRVSVFQKKKMPKLDYLKTVA